MAVPQSFIENLKMSCDIENIIGSYLVLKRQGRNLVGLCPFHSEKSPSMVVYPDNQSFYCFGCGAGGDIITFIMKIENLEYIETLRFLAQRVGLVFPENNEDDSVTRLKPIVLEINRQTARFYHELLKSEQGKPGLAYFEERGLSPKTVTKYGLGYAPAGWDNLRNFLKKQGFTEAQMIAAAVCAKGKTGDSCYDAFRNRVMFPIIDLRKNVIGFGGRVLDDSKPKYLNSSDTPVFKKSKNLFSLNFAKNHITDRLILAEGYMDVIAVNQAGFENVVATLGTSLTAEQCRLIATYTKKVIIAYDSDGAGRTATNRAVGLLEEAGVESRILDMKGAKDPDEYIKKFGAQRFKLLLDGANHVIAYQLGMIRVKYDLEESEQKAAYLGEATRYLSTVENKIEQEIYAGVLAKETGILKETLLSNITMQRKRKYRREEKKAWGEIQSGKQYYQNRVNPQKGGNLQAALAEEGILAVLMKNPDYLEYVTEKITPEMFKTSFNGQIFGIMIQKLQNNSTITLMDFTSDFSPEQMGELSGIFARQQNLNLSQKALDDYIEVLINEKYMNLSSHASELSGAELDDALERLRQKKKPKFEK